MTTEQIINWSTKLCVLQNKYPKFSTTQLIQLHGPIWDDNQSIANAGIKWDGSICDWFFFSQSGRLSSRTAMTAMLCKPLLLSLNWWRKCWNTRWLTHSFDCHCCNSHTLPLFAAYICPQVSALTATPCCHLSGWQWLDANQQCRRGSGLCSPTHCCCSQQAVSDSRWTGDHWRSDQDVAAVCFVNVPLCTD